MKEETLEVLLSQLSEIADLFESTDGRYKELCSAKRRIEVLPQNLGPEDAATLRRLASLLRSTADMLEEWDWTFQSDDAAAAAEMADHLADLAEEEAAECPEVK